MGMCCYKQLQEMMEHKSSEKKGYRPLGESKNSHVRNESMDFLDNSIVRVVERHDNINTQLHSNYSQIKQLLKDRKTLIKAKHESIQARNKERVANIMHAREQDLKNQARLLNDPTIINLVERTESLSKSKQLLVRVSEIKDMNNFAGTQIGNGKRFWDRHKEFEREKKRKVQLYTNNSKLLKDLNQRQRVIFSEIERCQIEIVNLLFRNRDDPDHMKRAERLNQEIEKRKNALREMKVEKGKIKKIIMEIIDDLLEFSRQNQDLFKKKIKEIDDIFAGSDNIGEFDAILSAIEKILVAKGEQNMKVEAVPVSIQGFGEVFRGYDIIFQEVEKLKEEEDHVFSLVNEELKENIKGALMERIFMSGVSFKQDPNEIWRKCKEYRKILFDLNEDRPRLESEVQKINSMSSALYPMKKSLSTEDARRQDLKRELKKLCAVNLDLQEKEKEQKNFQFNMEELIHKRKVIETEINESAQKINLVDYKNKMRDLENINKRIAQKNDAALSSYIYSLRNDIEEQYSRLRDQYEDLIQQVEINDQQPSRGVFLSKLQKRLSLI